MPLYRVEARHRATGQVLDWASHLTFSESNDVADEMEVIWRRNKPAGEVDIVVERHPTHVP